MICPRCHRRNEPNWKYCIACGVRLTKRSVKNPSHSRGKAQATSKSTSAKTIGFNKKGIFFLNTILVILIALATMTMYTIYGEYLQKHLLNYIDVTKSFDGSDWNRYEVKEGNYSVLTPKDPKMQKVYRSISQLDNPLTFYDYTDALDGENIISFAYAQYPSAVRSSDIESIFDALTNETLLQNNLQLVEGTDEDFLGYPSIEFTGRSLEEKEENVWYIKYLYIIKGNNIYMLSYKDRTQEYKGYSALKNSFIFNE